MIELKKMIDQTNKVARLGQPDGLSLLFAVLFDSEEEPEHKKGTLTSCAMGVRIAECVQDKSHPEYNQRGVPTLIARFISGVIKDEAKGAERMEIFARTIGRIASEFVLIEMHSKSVGEADQYGMGAGDEDEAAYQVEKMLKAILKNK